VSGAPLDKLGNLSYKYAKKNASDGEAFVHSQNFFDALVFNRAKHKHLSILANNEVNNANNDGHQG